MTKRSWFAGAVGVFLFVTPAQAQEPVAWGDDLVFHTFSIVAIDPDTGESGVIVTTRNPCVGNAVPWVRPGVGAVATQGGTRLEYGNDLLNLLEQGVSPQDAMDQVVAADEGRERRQVGVIGMDGQFGTVDGLGPVWGGGPRRLGGGAIGSLACGAGQFAREHRVFVTFQRSEGSRRHLADRLIEALYAGQVLGGDGRHGETQSAAVLVADPRPGCPDVLTESPPTSTSARTRSP